MAYNEQEREPSQRTRVLRAESNARLSSTATTDSVGSSHIEPVLPSTTLVAATLTDSIPVDQPTSTQVPSQPPPLSSNLSINILASPPHTSSTASPHVPSESDVPEKWAPVYLDGEKDRQFRFLGGMTLVCVLTVVGMIAIGWWRGLWKPKFTRRAHMKPNIRMNRELQESMAALQEAEERMEEVVARARCYY